MTICGRRVVSALVQHEYYSIVGNDFFCQIL